MSISFSLDKPPHLIQPMPGVLMNEISSTNKRQFGITYQKKKHTLPICYQTKKSTETSLKTSLTPCLLARRVAS